MKKLILICALFTIYFGSFAQTDSVRNKKGTNNYQKQNNENKNCTVKMENGKMIMTVDEKTVVIDKQMTMKNGTIVMMDGTVKTKDGKTMQLKDGECIDMSGKMIVVKNSQIQKNYNSTDK